MSLLTEHDLYLFNEGSHIRLYRHLGAHRVFRMASAASTLQVWAPDAEHVSVMGSFNGWNNQSHPMYPRGQSGIWETFIPRIQTGEAYKYHIQSRFNGYKADKADPFAFHAETPPHTASKTWDLEYDWNDEKWMADRRLYNSHRSPMSIYEVHLDRGDEYRKTPTARSTIGKLPSRLPIM
jgi:1,4-alpha-glucan branching enzyme